MYSSTDSSDIQRSSCRSRYTIEYLRPVKRRAVFTKVSKSNSRWITTLLYHVPLFLSNQKADVFPRFTSVSVFTPSFDWFTVLHVSFVIG